MRSCKIKSWQAPTDAFSPSCFSGIWFEFRSSIGTISPWESKLANFPKASLELSQNDVEELKPFVSKLEEAKYEIDQLNSDLAREQELKVEYLKNQSRGNNICIKGIAKGEKETWDEVESKIKDAIKAKLDLDIDIERAHRVE